MPPKAPPGPVRMPAATDSMWARPTPGGAPFCTACPGEGAHKMSCTPLKAGRVGLRQPWPWPDGAASTGRITYPASVAPVVFTSDPGVITETEYGDDSDGAAVTEEG